MTDPDASECKETHFDYEFYDTELREETAIEHVRCNECGRHWEYERQLTTAELASKLRQQLRELLRLIVDGLRP